MSVKPDDDIYCAYNFKLTNLVFAIPKCFDIYREYTNVSVYNTTIYFIYIK